MKISRFSLSDIMDKNKSKYDITFICRMKKDHFAQPILHELEKKYSIQYLYPEHKRDYWHYMVEGRIIWIEWAQKFAWLVSQKKWKNKKVIVRLHRWEIETEYMKKIKWDNIDLVIFVNDHFEDEFKQKINNKINTVTIPNAIRIDDFKYTVPSNGKNLCAYSLAFNPVKGYLNLLVFFSKLLKKDSSFRLTILARKPANEKELDYLHEIEKEISCLQLNNSVEIIKRKPAPDLSADRKNISNFLSHQNIIVSFSKLESFHYSFAEGLLCGLQGFYNAWQNTLIKKFWNNWGYNSEDEMIDAIIEWNTVSLEEKKIITKNNRKYVIDNFGSETIANKIERKCFD